MSEKKIRIESKFDTRPLVSTRLFMEGLDKIIELRDTVIDTGGMRVLISIHRLREQGIDDFDLEKLKGTAFYLGTRERHSIAGIYLTDSYRGKLLLNEEEFDCVFEIYDPTKPALRPYPYRRAAVIGMDFLREHEFVLTVNCKESKFCLSTDYEG